MSAIPVYTPDGKLAQLPDDQVQDATLSGAVGFPKGAQIPVVGPDGTPGYVAAEEAHSAFGNGYRYAPADVRSAEMEAKYGTPGQQAITGVEGFVRGATLGASDWIERELQIAKAEDMAGRKETNPWTAGLSEVGGAVFPSLIPGGQFAPASLVMKGGGIAETALRAALGTGKLAGLAAKAGAGALMGTAYAGGNLVSEAALGDPHVVAEHALTALGLGALTGGIIPPALDLIGGGMKAMLDKVPLPSGIGAEDLETFGDERLAKSIASGQGPMLKWQRKINNWYGGSAEVGAQWREMGLGKIGNSIEDNAAIAKATAEATGTQIGETYKLVDSLMADHPEAAQSLPGWSDLFATLRKDFLAPMADKPSMDTISTRLSGMVDRYEEVYGSKPFTLESAWEMSKDIGNAMNWSSPELKPVNKALNAMRHVVQGFNSDVAERVIPNVPGTENVMGQLGGSQLIANLNRQYSVSTLASDILKDRISASATNRTFSPSDHLVGLGGALLGAGEGIAGALTGGASGIGLGLVNKLARQQGNQLLAATSYRLAAIEEKIAAQQGLIGSGVKAFMAVPGLIGKAVIPGAVDAVLSTQFDGEMDRASSPAEGYQRQQQQIRDLQSNPGVLVDRLTNVTAPIAAVAPQSAAALSVKAKTALDFLASKIPPQPQTMTGQPAQAPSDAEIARWGRYVNAVKNPLGILDGLAQGRIPSEAVETLRVVYPGLYAEMQRQLTQQLVEKQARGESLSIPQRRALSIFLGQPVDSITQPGYGQAMQTTFAPTQGQGQPQPKSPAAPRLGARQSKEMIASLTTPGQKQEVRP